MSERAYTVVWEETYDTFGTHEKHEHSRWLHKESAELVAAELSRHWGTRAWTVDKFAAPKIQEMTPTQVKRMLKREPLKIHSIGMDG
jgi:hypothetical protein